MKITTIIKRFLIPGLVITAIGLIKYRCRISPRAEVELSRHLRIGKGTDIGSFTKIKATEGPLTLGANVSIAAGCFISAERGGVEIGDHTMIGPNVSIVGNDYRYDRLDIPVAQQEKTSKGIRIGKDVWIGAGCAVLDGVTIGDHAIIAPNSTVTRSIGERMIADGSPASAVFERR